MRLSDLMGKKNSGIKQPGEAGNLASPKRVVSPHVKAEVPAVEVPKAEIVNPVTDLNGQEGVNNHKSVINDNAFYNSAPNAIYQAATELNIPIPGRREELLVSCMNRLLTLFKRISDVSDDKAGVWDDARGIVDSLATVMALDASFAPFIQNRTKSQERLVAHSINSAVIAMDLVAGVSKTEHQPREIGAAAMLHDVGMMVMGLNMEWNEDDEKYRSHVSKGVEVLKRCGVPEAIVRMVSQHHERLDGHGYPAGISGKDFLLSSQIVALSEGYERLMFRSESDDSSDETNMINYIQATLDAYRNAIDRDVLKAFISLKGFYPNGVMVEMNNRSICVVLRQNEGFPMRPVVQEIIDDTGNHVDDVKVVDLRMGRQLSIIRIVTRN